MKKQLLILITIAILLRIPFLFFAFCHPSVPYTSHDSIGYEAIAQNMLRHGSYSIYLQDPQIKDPVRMPGYPLFLAGVYAVFPNNGIFVVLLQMVMDIGIVALLLYFGRILKQKAAGFIAALLYAFNIHQIFFSTQLLTELLFTVILLLGISCFFLFIRERKGRILLTGAVCFGLAIMVRPIAILLPVVPLVFLLKRRISLRLIGVFILLVSILPLFWTIRNSVVFRKFFLTNIHSVNLILYHAPSVIADIEHTTRDEGKRIFFSELVEKYHLSDYDIDYFDDNPQLTDKLAREARGIVRAYPLLFIKHHFIGTIKVIFPLNVGFTMDILRGTGPGGAGYKPIFSSFWQLLLRGRVGTAMGLVFRERISEFDAGAWFIIIIMMVYQIIVYCFVIVGLARHKFSSATLFLLLVIGYFILIPGVVGEARFRVPVEPLIAFLAAGGMVRRKI